MSLNPDNLTLSLMTCYAQSLSVDICHAVAFGSVFFCLVFDLWSVKMVYSNFRSFREARSVAPSVRASPTLVAQSPLLNLAVASRPGFNLTFTIRVLVFGLGVFAAIA